MELSRTYQYQFTSDSMTVQFMIHNSSERFSTFVANFSAKIDDLSKQSQWRYLTSDLKPADDATRGLAASKLTQNSR